MNETSIEARLLASTSVRSLQTEQTIARWLERLRWDVEHGPFYRDPDTSKLREIDVTASRYGSRIHRKQPQSAGVELVIEAKTLRDYHLVFAPRRRRDEATRLILGGSDRANDESLGRHGSEVAKALGNARLAPDQIAPIMHRFNRASKSAQCVVLSPPDVEHRASAVRETNVQSERDVDNSVLWKAVLALRAATTAERQSAIAGQLSDLQTHVEYARSLGANLIAETWDELRSSIRHISVFHPIVVIESRLWMSQPGSLTEVENCRFYQHSGERSQFWCDVVTLKSARKYMQRVTQHYFRMLRRLGLK